MATKRGADNDGDSLRDTRGTMHSTAWTRTTIAGALPAATCCVAAQAKIEGGAGDTSWAR